MNVFFEIKNIFWIMGGTGLFVRMMRDKEYPFYWYDKYCKNQFNPGFVEVQDCEGKQFDCVTAMELFEHFVNPLEETAAIFRCADTLIFTTELVPAAVVDTKQWEYFAVLTGQHISFYTKKSLSILGEQYGRQYTGAGMLHVFSKNKIPDAALMQCLQNAGQIVQQVQRPSLLMADYQRAVKDLKTSLK